MKRLFISYARDDTPMVEPLVKCLREHGFKVTWDNDLPYGKRYREVLRAQIEAADRVIVAWTRGSVDSLWVQQEADLAFKQQKLLPLRFETVEPPMPFGAIQSGDFAEWDRTADAECFVRLISELDAPRPSLSPNQLGGSTRPVVIRPGPARPSGQHLPLILALFAALAVLVPTLYHLTVWKLPGSEPAPDLTASDKPPLPTSTAISTNISDGHAGGGDYTGPTASASVPVPSPVQHPTSPPPPPRECCHATGGNLPCSKPRCSDCGGVECPK